jgi:hypothetical protein
MNFKCNDCGENSRSLISKRELIKRSKRDPGFAMGVVAEIVLFLDIFGSLIERATEYIFRKIEDGDQQYSYCKSCKRLEKFQ